MAKFTYNKVEYNVNFQNLTQSFIFFLENYFFIIFPALKTKSFCQTIILTILANTNNSV